MAYPAPPGLKISPVPSQSTSTTPTIASLPPRPPPATGGINSATAFKPSTLQTPSFSSAPGTRGYNAASSNVNSKSPVGPAGVFAGFQPRAVAAQSAAYRTHSPAVSASPSSATGYGPSPTTYSNSAYQAPQIYSQEYPSHYHHQQQQQSQQPQQSQQLQQPGYRDNANSSTPVAPQIRNPFPLPGQPGARGQEPPDPELEAQIAQWQSAYSGKDTTSSGAGGSGSGMNGTNGGRTYTNRFAEGGASSTGANTAPLGSRTEIQGANLSSSAISSAANADTGVAAVITGADGKQKTVIRSGGGQTWQDPSLLEWDPAHFRLFVGNLAGEVTDESLLKAFSKYPSVHKARVVRDKRTTKSKGYGFVSFVDGEEYFQAAKDMQGKYIGSHPVLLRKSTTEIRPTVSKDAKRGGKGGKGGYGAGRGGNGAGGGSGGAADGLLGMNGVQKKQGKTKGGLKVLG